MALKIFFFNLNYFSCNMSIKSEILQWIRFCNTNTPRVQSSCFNIFLIVTKRLQTCNSSVWPTLIHTNFKAFDIHSMGMPCFLISTVEMARSRFVFSSKTHSHKQLRCYLWVLSSLLFHEKHLQERKCLKSLAKGNNGALTMGRSFCSFEPIIYKYRESSLRTKITAKHGN